MEAIHIQTHAKQFFPEEGNGGTALSRLRSAQEPHLDGTRYASESHSAREAQVKTTQSLHHRHAIWLEFKDAAHNGAQWSTDN